MEDSEALVRELTNDYQWDVLVNKGEVDFSYTLPGIQRFRVNAFRQRNAFAASLRLINTEIPELEDLGLPPVVKDLTKMNSGTVLVTGPTGSGKSTTLASLIEVINQTRGRHILPWKIYQYLFRHEKAL